ncbi:MAG: hypothetical protein KKF27_20465 [Gammaproteobacteria bacterium]|nr:hypothetical protein [Gammaproteobacteria bacterium]MBU2685622.1 hypothetical protein [Gammaproteobacteria bacterium]
MVKEIHYFNTFLSKGKTFIDQKDLIKMLLDYKDRCNEEQKKVVDPIIQMILNIGSKE